MNSLLCYLPLGGKELHGLFQLVIKRHLYSYRAVFQRKLQGKLNGWCLGKTLKSVLLIVINFISNQAKRNRAMLASNPARDNLIVMEWNLFDKGFLVWLPLYFIPELPCLKKRTGSSQPVPFHIPPGLSTHI
jgi:hypothetical protein